MAIDEYRLQIQQKISEYERLGKFNEDVENDPPSKEIKPEDVDYLGEKFKSKVSTKIANAVAYRYIMKLIRRKKILIKDVVGMEKLQQLNTGFVLTCNHFNPNDNFALHYVLHKYLKKSKKQFYKVIREGNYSNFGGLFGYFFRHCNTLPLSRNIETMKNFAKAVDKILTRGDVILVYPEQAMWWNYRKPRPLKQGAFTFATRSNVPVIPCFISMKDSELIGDDGLPIQEYYISFGNPIYPETEEKRRTAEEMKNENFNQWKKIYEDFYQKELVYSD